MNFGNFAPKVGTNLATKFTAMFELQRDMNSSNPFIQQGRSMPDNVRSEIVERWLNGGGHREIGRKMNLPKSTVTNIVNKFLERGDSQTQE